ncbi:MAG: hypothetical protein GXP25_20070 [Planctomycetes bacterium]|nr:hypothetical protein [Planctomycetota bacterium]
MILALAAVGYRIRLFPAIMIFLRLAFTFIVAYACRDVFGAALAKIAPTWGPEFWSFIAFALLFGALFLVLTHATLVYVEADDVSVVPIIDRIGGGAAGAASGALIVGVLLVAWSMAVTFSPVRFVTNESDLKVDMGQVVLDEYGRLAGRIPGSRSFDTAQAVDAYRDADVLAVKKATSSPEKKGGPEKKGKGTAADIEDDSSNTNLKKQLLKDRE